MGIECPSEPSQAFFFVCPPVFCSTATNITCIAGLGLPSEWPLLRLHVELTDALTARVARENFMKHSRLVFAVASLLLAGVVHTADAKEQAASPKPSPVKRSSGDASAGEEKPLRQVAPNQNGPDWMWENIDAIGRPTARHEATLVAFKDKRAIKGAARFDR